MASAYLYVNAALYLLFAVWCTVSMTSTARNLGYEALNASGRSEYLVIYGGLQAGLAIVFWLLAENPSLHRFGLMLSLAIYVPIVLFRWITVIVFKAQGMTLAIAGLESALLLAALFLFFSQKSALTLS